MEEDIGDKGIKEKLGAYFNKPLYAMRFDNGLPWGEYYFSDGYISVCANQENGSISMLQYFGKQPIQGNNFLIGPKAITMECNNVKHIFQEITIYPFGWENRFGNGFESSLVIEGNKVIMKFSGLADGAIVKLVVDEDAFVKKGKGVWERKWLDIGEDKKLRGFLFRVHDYLRVGRPSYETSFDRFLHFKMPDLIEESETYGTILSDTVLKIKNTGKTWEISTIADKGEATFIFIFGNTKEKIILDRKRLFKNSEIFFENQKERYLKKSEDLPVLRVKGYKYISEMFHFFPLYLESVKIGDTGAFRASNANYWAWGWDITLPCFSLLYAGWYEEVKKAILFLNKTARDEDGGIGHAFTTDFQHYHNMFPGDAHNLSYLRLINRYEIFTSDLATIKRVYPRAKKIFLNILRMTNHTGFYPTRGMCTDFPEQFGRQNLGYVSAEMGWWYDACKSMERLAKILGDNDIKEKASKTSKSIEENFVTYLYNPENGYLYEAVEPDGDKNDIAVIASLGVMHGIYGEYILGGVIEELAKFSSSNFIDGNGIRWSPAFEKRGFYGLGTMKETFFTYYDIFLARLLRKTNRGKELERILSIYEQDFSLFHSVYEGKDILRPITTVAKWQTYSGGIRYATLIEGIAGLEMDEGGITYVPCNTDIDISLKGIHYKDTIWDIEKEGKGVWVESFIVDGKVIKGSYKIPSSVMTRGRHCLKIKHTDVCPGNPILMEAISATVVSLENKSNHTIINLAGSGEVPIKIGAKIKPEVTLNGRPVFISWDNQFGKGTGKIILKGKGELLMLSKSTG